MSNERSDLKREVKKSMSRLVAESLSNMELLLGVIEAIVDSDILDEETKRKLDKLEDVHQIIRTKTMYVNSNEMKRIDDCIDGFDVKRRKWQVVYFD